MKKFATILMLVAAILGKRVIKRLAIAARLFYICVAKQKIELWTQKTFQDSTNWWNSFQEK